MRTLLRIALVFYLLLLLILLAVIRLDGGATWLVTLYLFSPRWVVAAPLLVLLPLTIWKCPRWAPAYLLHSAVIFFAIMGGNAIPSADSIVNDAPGLNLMACNLGGGDVNVPKLIAMAKHYQIDAMLLQECPRSISRQVFESLNWNHRQATNLAIGSPHPLGDIRVLATQIESQYNAVAAVACDLTWSTDDDDVTLQRRIQLVGVHFPTFRPAFELARHFDGDAEATFETLARQYEQVARQALHAIQTHASEQGVTTLIGGDFNVPVDSVFYRSVWSSYRNALSIDGWGFNYTKFTRWHGIRIDHLLADEQWNVVSAEVGPNLGGDHNPVIAELQWTSF